ncbi:alpha-amylase [Streptomyces gobitricini]|uniref:alpha-amylase n=1 Tax=Streptomyces gobitricini TaxID=68211 RepID=UPI0031E3E13E
MKRSTNRMAIAVLSTAAACFAQTIGGTSAVAAPAEATPSCLQHSTSWRYTFVTNDCASTQHVTVEYRDGTTVPCRTAEPGDTVTFPGYGTGGNEVLGVAPCSTVSP